MALSKDGYLYTQQLDMAVYMDEQMNLHRIVHGFCLPVWAKVTQGFEQVTSAPVMYGSRLWFGTSAGIIKCVDTSTMQTLWTAETGGTVYALSMEQDTEGQLWLYTGGTNGEQTGVCRMNADTGEVVWTMPYVPQNPMYELVANVVVGKHELSDCVFVTINAAEYDGEMYNGLMLALEKETGRVLWKQPMQDRYCYSSPVAVYDREGNGWLVQVDQYAQMFLISGKNGEIVSSISLEGQRYSSIAAFGDMLVVGGTIPSGGVIFGVRVK